MKFREHRGSLSASLETMVDLDNSKEALVAHIISIFSKVEDVPIDIREDDVYVEYYGTDDRLEEFAATYIVTVRGYGVVGFVNVMPIKFADYVQSAVRLKNRKD